MVPRGAANAGGKPAVIPTTSSGIPEEGAGACTAFAPGGGGGRADEASGEVRREGAAEAAGARRLSVVGPPCCFAGLVTPRRRLDVRGVGARGVQGEGAARGLDAAAAAHPRPDYGAAVGRTEGDAGPDGEAGGAGGPDGDVQPGRGGADALAGAAGGGQGEQRGHGSGRPDAADVRDTPATTGLRRGADPARERAPAAVRDRAAVLSLGRAGRGRAGGGIVGQHPRPAGFVRHPADGAAEPDRGGA